MGEHNWPKGFTVLELLIAVAIIAILAAVAIPSYFHYIAKSHMSQVVVAVAPFQRAVELCVEEHKGELFACSAGQTGIEHNINDGLGVVKSIRVEQGIITATPRAQHGLTSTDTYILTPKWHKGQAVTWRASGGACINELVNC